MTHNPGENSALYGLVVCGGLSSRMGEDKSLLTYHDQPQRYHVYDLLEGLCEKVFISCSNQQLTGMREGYEVLTDDREFENVGPMAAVLTAFSRYPENDFVVIGCDYPFLTLSALEQFLESRSNDQIAAAFYNRSRRYEPLIAWYASACAPLLMADFQKGAFSLQQFLISQNAEKYQPEKEEFMKSIDTYHDFLKAKKQINGTKK